MFFWQRKFDKKSSLKYQQEVANDPGFPGQTAIFLSFETERLLRGWYYIKAAKIEAGTSNIVITPFVAADFLYGWFSQDIRQITGICFDPEIFKDPTKYVGHLCRDAGNTIFVRSLEDKKVWEKELQYKTFGKEPGFLGAKAVSQLENPHDVELPC